ncbi:MIF4G domain protein [Teladorsagia circumcincta]|uniref:MIF4G domain protein n=1 Tax=Teladorsagia circumcincta TaxID=45464 RepID=A0A2G9TXU4_TELCI|nr:MIF4G domain protein [Teladorsagia circumcincta]
MTDWPRLADQQWVQETNKRVEAQESHRSSLLSVESTDENALHSLDSTLKKTTAFMKKLKSLSAANIPSLIEELSRLNLSKFVEEMAAGIAETKLKPSDVIPIVDLCVAIASRYPKFSELILTEIKKGLPLKRADKISNPAKLRIDVGLICSLCRPVGWQISGIVPSPEGNEGISIEEGVLKVNEAITPEHRKIVNDLFTNYHTGLIRHLEKACAVMNVVQKKVKRHERTRENELKTSVDDIDVDGLEAEPSEREGDPDIGEKEENTDEPYRPKTPPSPAQFNEDMTSAGDASLITSEEMKQLAQKFFLNLDHLVNRDTTDQCALDFVSNLNTKVKFGVIPRAEALSCLRQLVYDFRGHSVDMVCAMIETAGFYLYRNSDSHPKMKIILDVVQKKKERIKDVRHVMLIDNAFFACIPPADSAAARRAQAEPPLMIFIRHLIVDINEHNVNTNIKCIRRLAWDDETVAGWCLKYLTSPWLLPYANLLHLASAVAGLQGLTYYDWISTYVIDACQEMIRISLEVPGLFNQRAIASACYLGELYNYSVCDTPVIYKVSR